MNKITQEQFYTLPLVDGIIQCPPGNYSDIKLFKNCRFSKAFFSTETTFAHCTFDALCKFEHTSSFIGCRFGNSCEFADLCEFGKNCDFGSRCNFGKASFSHSCSFGDACIFDRADFGTDCQFGKKCRFSSYCSFGRHCVFSMDTHFGYGCNFGSKCVFLKGCTLADDCHFGILCKFIGCTLGAGYFGGNTTFTACSIDSSQFGAECTFTECALSVNSSYPENTIHTRCTFFGKAAQTSTNRVVMSIQGAGNFHRTTYFFNLKEGIFVEAGCFLGTLDKFREKVLDDYHLAGNEVKTLQYLGFANIVAATWCPEKIDYSFVPTLKEST